LLEPTDALTADPFSLSLALCVAEDAYTVLPVVTPGSDVLRAVCPYKCSFTVFLAVLEVSLVASAVVPDLYSAALNRAHSELALIDLVYICKIVLSLSLELTVNEFTFVVAAISPFEATTSVLLPFVERPHIASATAVVTPHLFTLAMLSVHQPLS